MAEHRFFEGDVPYVSTQEFHADRERAPHLEQAMHKRRLEHTAYLVKSLRPETVVDLGCGDGGLLSLLKDTGIEAWGYDFQPSNVEAWAERGVTAEYKDFVNDTIRWADVAVITEVLEHLADPHAMLEKISRRSKWIIASSPHSETPMHHAEEHAWGWDFPGYALLIRENWMVVEHRQIDWCQIILARSKNL